MRCNFEKLIAYLNASLSESQSHEVFVHLQDCVICLEAVETMLQDRQITIENPALVEKKSGRVVATC
jgi:hypothetical protein